MKPGSRLVPPLAAAVLLLAASVAVVLWPEPSVPPAPAPPVAASRAPPSVPPSAAVAARAPAPVSMSEPGPAPSEALATEVAPRPGDVVPSPEREGPPQQNDALEPERPQTARWRLEKTERVTALLGRDVERLERERERAESRGDAQEGQRLATLIRRHREHLTKLREDMAQLAEAARHEPPEP